MPVRASATAAVCVASACTTGHWSASGSAGGVSASTRRGCSENTRSKASLARSDSASPE
ncbi:hypothetical protein [Variovorax sp. EBFNA2]|uniref:hypothetical protein n=1 Tax=Variovorax sp. EBFNA2 TaxID=3342097 RepID=UPI0029C0D377|nr:hypothetical protein [Variovorax boronicumulans]WPG40278.1 hypothetical protein RZE79_13285 [Variovorax boronicumulans]